MFSFNTLENGWCESWALEAFGSYFCYPGWKAPVIDNINRITKYFTFTTELNSIKFLKITTK